MIMAPLGDSSTESYGSGRFAHTTHRVKQTDASVSLRANQFHEFESQLADHLG